MLAGPSACYAQKFRTLGGIMQRFVQLFRRHPKLVSALLLSSTLALVFLGRFLVQLIYWSGHQNEPVQAWMTMGYVGHSWDLNPRRLDELAGLPKPVNGHPKTLAEIAKERGVPVSEVIAQVEAAIAQAKALEP